MMSHVKSIFFEFTAQTGLQDALWNNTKFFLNKSFLPKKKVQFACSFMRRNLNRDLTPHILINFFIKKS